MIVSRLIFLFKEENKISKNTIAVITKVKRHADFLKTDLARYFENHATINSYSVEDLEEIELLQEHCVVIASFSIFQKAKEKTRVDSEIIINNLSIEKKNLKRLEGLKPKLKVLVVNINYTLCMEVISLLYAHGYKDFEFVPYYEGCKKYDDGIEIAITPNEESLVPKGIKKVINIGDRITNVAVILKIAEVLELENFVEDPDIKKLLMNTETTDSKIISILGEKEDLKAQVYSIIEYVEQGFVITDVSGNILSSNSKARRLLQERTDHLDGFNIAEIIPELKSLREYNTRKSKEEKILKINDTQVVMAIKPIIQDEVISGFIINLTDFEEAEDHQNIIRSKISLEKHRAKYNFDDLKGESKLIKKAVANAKKFAHSQSSIMIYGDTGTGKEVFAQSIHNHSLRAKNNFVAVNCSAIPESLLESEMFGYDEGAFTGARRGGKIGYFELAHGGTLFLDEISELPISLQPKLLRAIEDMSVIKLGSNKIVHIDTRIIAATNLDLPELIKEGKFRQDLYYRLNVLPLKVPSLKERREDIFVLADYFAKEMHFDISFTAEAREIMEGYDWNGNVRELRNVVEYLKILDKDLIEKGDLPIYGTSQRRLEAGKIDLESIKGFSYNNDLIINFILREGRRIDLYMEILAELERAYLQGTRLGRAKLKDLLEGRNIYFSEQEIRSCMEKLNTFGFIASSRGSGSEITPAGVVLKRKIQGLLGDSSMARKVKL